jgi:succinoglycan biosynthesis protein ExoA
MPAHASGGCESPSLQHIQSAELAPKSFVSIIMPVRNESKAIERTLASLLGQNYPCDKMEIIVVDGRSDDGTKDIVSLAAARDPRIRLIENPRQIMAAGFNAGLRIARGDVIVMMGGHAELAPDYLKSSVLLLQQGIADCVGGPMTTSSGTPEGEAISVALSSWFGVGGVAFRVGCRERKYVDTVAFGAYTREILNRAGPLDEELVRCQDDEFNYRIRKLGGKILIAPEISSSYQSRSSVQSLGSQYFQYGEWKVRVLQKHPRQMQWRHFVPAVFVLYLVLSAITAIVHPFLGIPMFLLASVPYVVALSSVCISLAVRKGKWRLAPQLALVFPVLHFSYGAGFLSGLVKFCDRWREFWETPVAELQPPFSSSRSKEVDAP